MDRVVYLDKADSHGYCWRIWVPRQHLPILEYFFDRVSMWGYSDKSTHACVGYEIRTDKLEYVKQELLKAEYKIEEDLSQLECQYSE